MAETLKPNGKERAVPTLKANTIKRFEEVNMPWTVRVPAGVTPEDLSRPELWAAFTKFKPGDPVIARANDGTWKAYVEIVDVVHNACLPFVEKVVQLPAGLPDKAERIPAGHEIVREGNSWFARRISDGHVFGKSQGGHPTRELAVRALLDHATIRQAPTTR